MNACFDDVQFFSHFFLLRRRVQAYIEVCFAIVCVIFWGLLTS